VNLSVNDVSVSSLSMSEKKDRGNWNVPEINIQPNDGGSIPGLSSGLFSPRVTSMRLHVTSNYLVELKISLIY
jgi:hypothetical protein